MFSKTKVGAALLAVGHFLHEHPNQHAQLVGVVLESLGTFLGGVGIRDALKEIARLR